MKEQTIDMTGKICIVTGSNSGIGKTTALALAEMGATVVMIVRNREKGEAARQEIIERSGNKSVEMLIADLSSMDEVRRVAEEFKNNYPKLDVLVNNAGGLLNKHHTTSDGNELTFAINHLAPFLLTHELLDSLEAGAPSRVVNVSSGAHNMGKIDFDNLQSEKGYSFFRAYSNAKLMLVMTTYEFARRLEGTGISVNVLHPGFVRTNFGKSDAGFGRKLLFKLSSLFAKNSKKGAETQVYLASSPEVEGVTGQYFSNRKARKSSMISYDVELQKNLWQRTEEILGSSLVHRVILRS